MTATNQFSAGREVPWFRLAKRLSIAAACAASFCLMMAGCAPTNLTEPSPPPQGPVPGPPVYGPAPTTVPPTGGPAPATPPGMENRIGVGFLAPLTGPRAVIGQSMLRAAQLALFEVADKNFVLLPRDTRGTPDGARAAAQEALSAGARLLLGPVFSDSVKSAAPVARAAGVSLIAFTNDRSVAGDGVYVLGVSPIDKINRVVGYAIHAGKTRLAALIPASPFGDLVLASFQAAVQRAGGIAIRTERYEPTQESMIEAVKRLGDYDTRRAALLAQRKQLAAQGDEVAKLALRRLEGRETLGDVEFDAVLVPETGEQVKALAPLLPYYEVDIRRVKVLGIDDWSSRSLRREPALKGAWYAGPPPDALDDFAGRYRRVYGADPHPLAALAYDAAALSAVLASHEGGPAFDAASLTASNGFAGSAGLFRLLPSGVSERRFAVMEVQPQGLRVVSPPPKTFEALSN